VRVIETARSLNATVTNLLGLDESRALLLQLHAPHLHKGLYALANGNITNSFVCPLSALRTNTVGSCMAGAMTDVRALSTYVPLDAARVRRRLQEDGQVVGAGELVLLDGAPRVVLCAVVGGQLLVSPREEFAVFERATIIKLYHE